MESSEASKQQQLSNLVHTWLGSRNRMILAALLLALLAMLLTLPISPERRAANFTKTIQNDIASKEASFMKLAANLALMDKISTNGLSAAQLDSLSDAELGLGLFLFKKNQEEEPTLLFWNTQWSLPPVNFMEESDVSRLVTLKNGSYVHLSKALKINGTNYFLEGLIPVQWKYFIEIENLQSNFPAAPEAINSLTITQEPTSYKINSRFGNILFYLKKKPAEGWHIGAWVIALLLVIFALLTWLLDGYARKTIASKGIVPGILLFVVSSSLLRAILYWLEARFGISGVELFDPSVYSSGIFLKSMGDLLVNLFLFGWWVFFIDKQLWESSLPNDWNTWTKRVLALAMAMLLVVLTFQMATIVQSLIADAQISFNVTNFFGLSYFSFLGFFMLAFIGLVYFRASRILLRQILYLVPNVGYILYIVLAALGLLLLTLSSNTATIELNLVTLAWLLGYTALLQVDFFSGLQLKLQVSEYLFWIFLFATSIAAILIVENKKTEFEQRKRFAEKLSLQADPSNERLLSIALTYLDNDFLSSNFNGFKIQATNEKLKDSIINKNFSAYLNKFDTRIYVFDASNAPQPLFNQDPVSFDTLNTVYYEQGKKTSISDLRYVEQSFDKYSYISRKEIREGDTSLLGYFFIVAEPRKYNRRDALVPELFRQNRESILPEYTGAYTYAIYADNKLIDYFNQYDFPTSIQPSQLPKSEFELRKAGDFEELWYKKASDKIVVIAKKNQLLLEALTLFAYIFSAFLLELAFYWVLALLVRSRLRWKELKQYFQFNIQSQIHSTILMVSALSFIVIGAAIILFFRARYDRNNLERLSRTMQIMVNQVESKIKDHEVFNDGIALYDMGVNNDLNKLMEETSEIHGTDINLYDPQGNLKVTSRPIIYTKGVLSDKMQSNAFYHLSHLNAIQFVQQEKMGKVDYLSIYNPVRNSDGVVLAYLNVPSYSSQGELKLEISNFLVTLINLNALIFLIAGAVAFLITKRIARSFNLIGQKMQEINLGKMNQEIVWNKKDEIGELVLEYNKMVRQLDKSAAALAKSEREGAWRQMARQVAHEIKNPLTPMKLSIQYLQKAIDSNSPNVKSMTTSVASTLVEQIDHLSKIASDFSQFANIGNPKNEPFDLHDILASLAALYGSNENIDFKWNPLDRKLMVFADRTQLNRLFTNLLKNAMEACSEKQEKIVAITEQLSGDHVIVTVTDNGSGISNDAQSQIFTPNFTTKSSGTGLGLAMSKGIVENAQGELWFETMVDKGTSFFVKLPLVKIS